MSLPRLSIDGSKTFLLGVNYWSRAGGPRMWDESRFDEARVAAEIEQMRRIGLNVCRSFAFIPSFMPRPGVVSGAALERFRRFLDLCHAHGMSAIPSALVGHMSGENYDFPEQKGRNLYGDPELRQWQGALVGAIARTAREHPAVAAYLASNEMPLWGGRSSPLEIRRWAEGLRGALREHDSERPFSLGDGVMNLKGGQNGFDPRALAGVIDFVGPHTYHADSDPLRQAANAEYCLRSLTHLGLPILFEEFGCSSCQASESHQADYYREVIHACISSGASGALGWCFSDFDLTDEHPYSHHAFELGFGITRADGSEKPVCDELRRTAQLIDQIDFASFEPPRVEAAIVVPSYFNHTYPFSWEDRERMRAVLLQAYVLCLKAGIEAELVPEDGDLEPYRLLLAPSTQKLLAPTWEALLARASAGATVYWSYFAGDYGFHQGAWCHNFEHLTGCRHELRYACFDLPPATLELRGDRVNLAVRTDVGQRPYPRAFLPVAPLEGKAEVLARTDAEGRAALVRTRHGSGQVLLLTHPLEYYLAEQANINEADRSEVLYKFLAEEAGINPPARLDEPLVQARWARDANGPLLWLINHGWRAKEIKIDTPGADPIYGQLSPLRAGTDALVLEAKQVAVFRSRPS